MTKPQANRLDWSALYNSIFVRIYAGLVLIAFIAGLFAYLSFTAINHYRAKEYRESVASSVAYIISEGVARQRTDIERENWLSDASAFLNLDLLLQPTISFSFSRREQKRLDQGLAVVRDDVTPGVVQIIQGIPKQPRFLLTSRVGMAALREQQIKALPWFILDDLSYYGNNIEGRIKVIQQHVTFPMRLKSLASVNLDDDQRTQLRRKEVVLIFKQNQSTPSLTLIGPTTQQDQVLQIGPIFLFNWMPLQLVFLISALTLTLLSFGVYALIVPLHRKIRRVHVAVSHVRAGNFDTRVHMTGRDEVSELADSFDNMTDHIERLISAQRELTRAVSHELRTPVARIRFGVEMLADTESESSRWDQQSAIDKDIETLNDLIDEILTYAKLEEGTPSLNFEDVSINDLLLQIADETNALGLKHRVNIVLPEPPVSAMADRKYLHRVLQNLAGNAMRHANSQIVLSGGVRQGKAFVCVEDDGPGIPEADREKVFLPFARLDDSRTRASGGYGLGLSIVQRISFWFKGTMSVDRSTQLGGARFIMRWPAKQ